MKIKTLLALLVLASCSAKNRELPDQYFNNGYEKIKLALRMNAYKYKGESFDFCYIREWNAMTLIKCDQFDQIKKDMERK